MTTPSEPRDRLAEALEAIADRGDQVELSGRMIRLETPVNGDAGFAVLRILGAAESAFPVGAAAHGPNSVAIGVWNPPDMYLARWTQKRWVVGYRLPRGSNPAGYVGSEGRIPSRFEIGNWYATVPDGVVAAFEAVGLSLEEPPFKPPDPPPAPEPKTRARRTPAARPPAAPARAPAPRKPPAETAPPAPTSRVCPACNMRRALTQFAPGSDLCVDCR